MNSHDNKKLTEQAITFGEFHQLYGILTQPQQAQPDRPIIVFWNAGLVHKFGVHRIQVNLARTLAEKGFSCIRFDLAGIGDSPNITTQQSYEANAVANIQQAISFACEHTHCQSAVLVGFCSGALNAHDAMIKDSRIKGSVLIDAYAYRTFGFYFRFIIKLFTSSKWLGALTRRIKRQFQTALSGENALPIEWDFPPQQRVQQELSTLLQRDIQLYFIYTADMPKHFNHKKQFYRMFKGIDFQNDLQKKLSLDYFPYSDHLFTPLSEKNTMKTRIIDWIEAHFKSPH